MAVQARAMEDAVSVDERRLEDGDDLDLPRDPGFSGDARLRLREVRPPGSTYSAAPPSLQHNVYFLSRVRVRQGPVLGGLLAKRAAVGPALSAENLQDYGVLKGALELRPEKGCCALVAGNYSLSFGQGLLFYDGFGEFVRPSRLKENGPRADYSGGLNDYMRGAALRADVGPWGADVFWSEKPLDFPLNPDGTVNANLDDLHNTTGDVQTADALADNNSVKERLAGGRFRWRSDDAQFGATVAQLAFDRVFNPAARDFSDARAFRGDRLTLAAVDGRWRWGSRSFFGEAARSRPGGPIAAPDGGSSWTVGVLQELKGVRGWLSLFDYAPGFVSPHGKGIAFAVSGSPQDLPRNQTGAVLGGEWGSGAWKGRVNLTAARFPESVGDGDNSGPLAPSEGLYFLIDQEFRIAPRVDLRLSFQERQEEKVETDPGSGFRRQVEEKTDRARIGFRWKTGPVWTWSLRYDERWERTPAFETKSRGSLWMFDAVAAPGPRTSIKGRVYVFNSPSAYLTTGPEEIWDGVVYDRLAGNLGNLRGAPGTRLYVIVRHAFRAVRVWVKFENTRRPAEADDRVPEGDPPRQAWHLQLETHWGRAKL